MEPLTGLLYIYAIAINLIGFTVMGKDKKKAQRNEYRMKESTLWQVAILGGSVGAFLGMKVFRHKTKHTLFAFGFPILAMLHSFLFIWLNGKW
ncbi:DUF1294 domain-containing protein [Rossellomorea sp. AcN35-11]|nr:DUF1294 domain-containing protein [Rossellomorea aquimaris]WJV27828.1 DUF1294 domain-containing protein [Rossellomorea sp. AcN35-11]